jgi:hypothetical protein
MMEHQPETSPDLSIIIVNWNTSEPLYECLTTLETSSLVERTEVLVVDNASTDGSADMVAREFPDVRLLRNTENVGFARANNQGIAATQSPYVLLLNSDTLMPPETLSNLLGFALCLPEVGACSPRLLGPDGEPQAFAFGGDPTPFYLMRRGLWRLLLRRPLHNWRTPHTRKVDWVSGACMLVNRAAIEQVGTLDEGFFMYFEDNDWCLRMRRGGWHIYYYPEADIIHMGGQSLAQNPEARRAYYESLRYFYHKHYGPLAQLWLHVALRVYRLLVSR